MCQDVSLGPFFDTSSPASTSVSGGDESPRPEKERRLSEARNRALVLEGQRRAAEQRLVDLSRDIGTKTRGLEELQQKVSNIGKEIEGLRRDRASTNVHCQRLHADYRAATREIERLEEDMAKDMRRSGWSN